MSQARKYVEVYIFFYTNRTRFTYYLVELITPYHVKIKAQASFMTLSSDRQHMHLYRHQSWKTSSFFNINNEFGLQGRVLKMSSRNISPK